VNHKDWDMLIKQDISFGIVGRIEKRPEQRETIMVVAPADATSVMIAGPTQEQRDSVMIQVTFETLSRAMMDTIAPKTVIAPLITDAFDILDLAELLTDFGFRGELVAVTRPLPRKELILREVRAINPSLTISIREMV
jgi:hypothetical protein